VRVKRGRADFAMTDFALKLRKEESNLAEDVRCGTVMCHHTTRLGDTSVITKEGECGLGLGRGTGGA
jgi:hypothetical protein